jgi:predicted DNA-binding transcriptional regulator AlpA
MRQARSKTVSDNTRRDPYRLESVLSFAEVIGSLGISKATFFRRLRKQLPIIQLSDRRLGVRESDYVAYLERRASRPIGA